MSLIINKWKARYHALEVFEMREYKRMIMFSCAMLACFMFLLWTVYNAQIQTLIVVNIIAIAVYLYAFVLVAQIRFKHAAIAFTLTNLFAVVFHTTAYGTQSGIHMLIWPIVCLFAIHPSIGLSTARKVFALAVLTFISLQFFIPASTANHFYAYSNLVFIGFGGAMILFAIISMSLSLGKRRKKLERLANRDNLTDLYNRRFFTTFLHYQLAVSAREKRSFTLAMADIDHFKSINDNHGHDVGDKVLNAVSECFRTYLGQSDAACRWGGEEFLIYLPESKVEYAELVVQAIASVISDQEIDGLSVTMSFGLVESDGNETLDDILQRVDALMYQAKSQGRNNIQTKLLKE